MRELIEWGETLYTGVAAIIPPTFPVTAMIEVRLNGKLRSQSPFVDGNGAIQLYRYPPGEGGYRAMFAHELVHAMGFDQALKTGALDWPSLGFYNEAWAEYIAQVIDPAKTGFPLYGFDEDIVVGHWVMQGGLSMGALRASHRELNERCQLQAYAMRASWFRYVDVTFGRQVSLDIMYSGREMTPSRVEEVLGQPLIRVDENWRAWVLSRYHAHPAADAEAKAYRERTGFYAPCTGSSQRDRSSYSAHRKLPGNGYGFLPAGLEQGFHFRDSFLVTG